MTSNSKKVLTKNPKNNQLNENSEGTIMNREEINKLQIYLRNTFKNNNISIIPRADKTEDSAEFHINNEFFGIVFKDTEEGETTFHLEMSIIEEDLI